MTSRAHIFTFVYCTCILYVRRWGLLNNLLIFLV